MVGLETSTSSDSQNLIGQCSPVELGPRLSAAVRRQCPVDINPKNRRRRPRRSRFCRLRVPVRFQPASARQARREVPAAPAGPQSPRLQIKPGRPPRPTWRADKAAGSPPETDAPARGLSISVSHSCRITVTLRSRSESAFRHVPVINTAPPEARSIGMGFNMGGLAVRLAKQLRRRIAHISVAGSLGKSDSGWRATTVSSFDGANPSLRQSDPKHQDRWSYNRILTGR